MTDDNEPKEPVYYYPSEKQTGAFFEAIGRALSAWQRVEINLCLLFDTAIGPTRHAALGAAFHQIQTFHLKLMVTNAALTVTLAGKELLPQWTKLKDLIQEKEQRRNQLAHYVMYTKFHEASDNERIYLAPSILDFRPIIGKRSKIRSKDMERYEEIFCLLSNKISLFRHHLMVDLGLLPASAEPEQNCSMSPSQTAEHHSDGKPS